VPVVRVVLLGKGGSGKSTLAGLVCASLSERGERVVALDADSVPGLAQVLGMAPSDDWFLAGMAVRQAGGWKLENSPAETVRRCSRTGPGGVRFLQVGNADATMKEFTRERCPEQWSGTIAFNTVVRSFDDEGGWVIVDLHGGTLQVASGMAGTAGIAMVVVEPFAKSVLTARRFVGMGEWPPDLRLVGVANKVASPDDVSYIESELAGIGVPLWASIPLDPAIASAERKGQPLVSLQPGTPARRAVAALVERLGRAAATSEGTPAVASA
jgi:CO dehydrogenase maturation factor